MALKSIKELKGLINLFSMILNLSKPTKVLSLSIDKWLVLGPKFKEFTKGPIEGSKRPFVLLNIFLETLKTNLKWLSRSISSLLLILVIK